jgi:putative DNA primase/helicase
MLLDPTAHYGRFIHLLGQSGSGKGTMLRLWLEMFGTENTRSINSFLNLKPLKVDTIT